MLDLERQVYVIFGLGGMLGLAFYKKLIDTTSDYRIYAFDHARVDICNKSHVSPLLDYLKPTVIINCASVSEPDICESAIAGAHNVNTMGAAFLATEAERCGAKLVTMSHYLVFDGSKKPYTEKAQAKPVNILGKTKEDGERRVRLATDNHLIIRPGWLFGEEGNCVFKEWIAQTERNMKIHVTENQIISPIFADDLVEATMTLVNKDAKGTFHIANSGTPTTEEVAKLATSLCGLKDTVSKCKSAYKAPIPSSVTLSCTKYKSVTRKTIRPWPDAVKECLYRMGRFHP